MKINNNPKLLLALMVLFVVVVAIDLAEAQSNICNISVSDLMKCKPAVTPPNPTQPTADCCSALSHADLHCLCGYKNSKLLPSFGIDPNLAIQLPRKCNLPHPPNC
ncbi:hypothetical protein EZV62_001486 [Acer yangbiense]|uniref:Bifunctional inhibitor/plant lipid transfer protein/seed storage helical domain-containing protein n=1 Tax=Acer yangbiense TaxID=1000413 RepID=A0A5C7IU57_9ROSI|nr:hypothetical protein EZV62_001486 [Acer yangbiense]